MKPAPSTKTVSGNGAIVFLDVFHFHEKRPLLLVDQLDLRHPYSTINDSESEELVEEEP